MQFTAPDKERHIANRELGTIESIDEHGNARIKLDSGREVRLSLGEHPHVDYGYAVTSHSSQGSTADRVLINVDSEQAGEQLVNSRLAYVGLAPATMRRSTPTTPRTSAKPWPRGVARRGGSAGRRRQIERIRRPQWRGEGTRPRSRREPRVRHGCGVISGTLRGDAGRTESARYPRDHESGRGSRRREAGTLLGPNP